jgi:hypothetical protein
MHWDIGTEGVLYTNGLRTRQYSFLAMTKLTMQCAGRGIRQLVELVGVVAGMERST